MSEESEKIFAEARRKLIHEILLENGQVSVSNLCKNFNVSAATIRNDLSKLEQTGALKRIYGGAIIEKNIKLGVRPNSLQISTTNVSIQQAIARAAVTFVQPGDIIAIDSGNTMFEFSKLLNNIDNLTVVTNDLRIASYLEQNTNVATIMAGGLVRRHLHCTTGQTAIDAIANLHVDKVFATANGVNPQRGLSTSDIDMANFKTRLINSGDKVFLLVDSSKFTRNSFVFYASLSKVDVLITNDQNSKGYLEAFQQYGIEVISVKSDTVHEIEGDETENIKSD